MKKNFLKTLFSIVLLSPCVGFANFSDEASGKAFLGLGAGSLEVTPLVLGADYKFLFDDVDFFSKNDLRLPVGILFWGASEGAVDYSVFEVSSGLEKTIYTHDKFLVNAGGRVGIARVEASVSAPFLGTVSDSETSLFIAPYGEFLYPINENMAVGGEVRIPFYFSGDIDAFDVVYMLGSFSYIF